MMAMENSVGFIGPERTVNRGRHPSPHPWSTVISEAGFTLLASSSIHKRAGRAAGKTCFDHLADADDFPPTADDRAAHDLQPKASNGHGTYPGLFHREKPVADRHRCPRLFLSGLNGSPESQTTGQFSMGKSIIAKYWD